LLGNNPSTTVWFFGVGCGDAPPATLSASPIRLIVLQRKKHSADSTIKHVAPIDSELMTQE
jgi:hypothetical protein